MGTAPVEHVEQALPHLQRPSSGLLLLVGSQLALWTLFGLVFFLAVRPYHLFADILAAQAAVTAALGLVASTVLGRLYTVFVGRSAQPMFAVAFVLVGSVLLGLAWYELAAWIGNVIDPFERVPMSVPGGMLFARAQMPLYPAALLLWGILFLGAAQRRAQREQEERVLRSEALAQQARLRMLRYQLNPHFLFNALNSIGALAGEAPDRVHRMVGELSGFLRYSLLEPEQLEVSLGDELRAITHYLEVEKVRFEDDLEVRIDVEPSAAARRLPAFLVLPLVENAIKHGQRTSAIPLRIEITGHIQSGHIHIAVKNTGQWVTPSRHAARADGTQTGLHNVRERLQAHYPGRHAFQVHEEGGWVSARIRIDGAG